MSKSKAFSRKRTVGSGKRLLFLVEKICLVETLTLLVGCGPLYNTEYIFTPPSSRDGTACVFQCENVRSQCRQLEEIQASQCEQRAAYDRSYCETQIAITKGRDPKWYECGTESCSADYDICDERYRGCYQTCGGKVDAVTRCVANCPPPLGAQAPPAK